MKGFGQLWWLLMINLDQNNLSQKECKTKQAWRGSSGLSYLSFVLKPEGKSGLVTLQRGLEDGVMFFTAICGQEVDCDCNPLQLCTVKLPASSLKAESNALDTLFELIYPTALFSFSFFVTRDVWLELEERICLLLSWLLTTTLLVLLQYVCCFFFPTDKPRLFQNKQGNLSAEEIFCLQISVGFDTLY